MTLVLFAATLAPQCLADTVILSNGDRITGKIQRIEQGKVVVLTDYAGEVKIDWQRISTLDATEAMTVHLDDDTRLYGRVAGDNSVIHITPEDGTAASLAEVKRVESVSRGNTMKDQLALSGRINVGTSQTTGNTHLSTAHLDAELAARKGHDRYTAGTYYNHAADHSVPTASNALLYGKYDHFFTKKWYSTLNASIENDRFADIQLRSIAGVGLGYQIFESVRTNLAVEAGGEYVHTDHYQLPTESYPAVRLAVKYDHYLIPDRLQFFYKGEFYVGQGDNEPSFAKTQTGLRVPVRDRLVTTLQYDVDWNAHPPPGFVRTDKMLLFTLGYHW